MSDYEHKEHHSNGGHQSHISATMHYTVMIALLISLITSFLLGALLVETLFGTGLNYFESVRKQVKVSGASAKQETGTSNAAVVISQLSNARDTNDQNGAAVAVGPDGLPVIVFRERTIEQTDLGLSALDALLDPLRNLFFDEARAQSIDFPAFWTVESLKLVKCLVPSCSQYNISTIEEEINDSVGTWSSVAVGNDNNPVVVYNDDSLAELKIALCADPSCTTSFIRTLDSYDDDELQGYGQPTAVALDSEGVPHILYFEGDVPGINLISCIDKSCAFTTSRNVPVETPGAFFDIVIDANDIPTMLFKDRSDDMRYVAKCTASNCPDIIKTALNDAGPINTPMSLALNSSGNPVISYYDYDAADYTDGSLMFALCKDQFCSRNVQHVMVDGPGMGAFNAAAVSSDGSPVVAYYDFHGTSLRTAKCTNQNCTNMVKTVLDGNGSVGAGVWLDLSVTPSGIPVVTYVYDSDNYKAAVCETVSCKAKDDSGGRAPKEKPVFR